MDEQSNMMSWILNVILHSVICIFSTIILSLLAVVTLPYRVIACFLIKLKYPEAEFLSSLDAVLCTGTSMDENQLLLAFLCNGTVDIDLFRSTIMEKFVKPNPRFYNHVVNKCGYSFWLKEENFKIEDHVLYHPDFNISTKQQWKEVQDKLHYKAVPQGFSPWFFHFVTLNPDYEESDDRCSFFIVFTWYHCLGDGYSILYNFLNTISDYEKPKLMMSSVPRPTFFQEFLMIIQSVCLLGYFAQEFFYIKNVFKPLVRRGKKNYWYSGNIKIETIKCLMQKTRFRFYVILFSCMMTALEKFFRNSNLEMPNEITVSIPQVLWTREDEVSPTNNFYLVYYTLPFSGKSGIHRLREVNEVINSSYTRIKKTTGYFLGRYLGNYFPSILKKFFYHLDYHSAIFTMVAMEELPPSVLGQRKLQCQPINRLITLIANQGIVFQPFTCGDHFDVCVQAKSSIATEEQLQQMVNDFQEDLQLLTKELS